MTNDVTADIARPRYWLEQNGVRVDLSDVEGVRILALLVIAIT